MAYSSLEQIEKDMTRKSLLELTDNGGEDEVAPMVEDAITTADGEIDSYIRMAVDLPVEPTPTVINKLSRTIAVYRLNIRRGTITKEDIVRINYEDAVKMLKGIASGEIHIGVKRGNVNFRAI